MAHPVGWRNVTDLESPDDLEMPSLADLDTDDCNMGSLIRVIFEVKELPVGVRGRHSTYVRLASRAVRAYERARSSLVTQIEARSENLKDSIGATWRTTDEFETLFNSVHRALRIAWELKGMRESPVTKKHLLEPDVFRTVNKLRDMSEHIEDRLIGKHPHAFLAYDRGFEYADIRLEYAEVASWLRHLDNLSRHVINVIDEESIMQR